jgi:hypothetical protein
MCAAENRTNISLDHRIWQNAQRRAKKKNLPFTLIKGQIAIPEVCPILGISLNRYSECVQPDSFTVDEIIPGLGYVPGNVQVLSAKANTMKSSATPAELILFADWVYRTFK